MTDLIAMLKQRYSDKRGWSLLTEVGNGTGTYCCRHADAIAFGLWPSRGLAIYGFECKRSRSDWLKELENPEKAEEIAKYCDLWWLVVSDESIVKDGELPPSWGLLVARGDNLHAAIHAKELNAAPIDRLFLMALIRKYAEQYTPKADIRQQIADAEKRGEERGSGTNDLAEAVKVFEEASGLNIRNSWQNGEIGEAVKLILKFGPENWKEHFRRYAAHLLYHCNKFKRELKKFDPTIEAKQ